MLVLKTWPHDKIILRHHGHVIGTVVVVEHRLGQLRLGFDFFPEFEINREKLDYQKYPEVENENSH